MRLNVHKTKTCADLQIASQILGAIRKSLNSTSTHPPPTSAAATAPHIGALGAPFLAKVKSYPVQLLDALVARHFRATQSAPLAISGRYLPLVYLLVATLISPFHNQAVVVVDVDGKFDVTRVLQCAPYPFGTTSHSEHTTPAPEDSSEDPARSPSLPAQQVNASTTNPGSHDHQLTPSAATHGQRLSVQDLRHVHVYRPARGPPSHIRDVLVSAEHHMIYNRHASVAREWWGTIVIGGGSPTALGSSNADVTTGWKGWLRVNRDEVRGFPVGTSLEEALRERDQRQRAVDAAAYSASCAWGSFTFSEASGP